MSGDEGELSDYELPSNSSNEGESDDSNFELYRSKRSGLTSRLKTNQRPKGLKKGSNRRRITSKPKSKGKFVISDLVGVKEELSEDMASQMSDINPPSLSTRMMRKHQRKRKTDTASSTSSAFESDNRKTRSEPPLITLDSESDTDRITESGRPNRTARVQGELIRKLCRISSSNAASSYNRRQTSGSSSSDEDTHNQVKKKTIKVPVKSKSYFTKQLLKQKRLKLKKRNVTQLPQNSSSMKATRRLKIRKLHKRFERRKKEYPISKRRTSKESDKMSEKEKKTFKKLEPTNDEMNSEHNEPKKVERRGRPRKYPLAKTKVGKKGSTGIEDDIRKIINAPKLNLESKTSKNNIDKLDDEDCNKKDEDNSSDTRGSNSDKKDFNSKKSYIKSDLEKIKANTPDSVAAEESEEETKDRKLRVVTLKSRMQKGRSYKNKIKTSHIIPRRGRPRLTDSITKPSSSNKIKISDAMSLLNIKAQVPFLQSSFCFDVAPKLSKCRECRLAVYRTSRKMYNSYCRFMEYRKLCYHKSGLIQSAGFSNPSDATADHLSQWLPNPKDPPKDLNFETAKSLLEHIGDQFCDLIEQEREALSLHIGLHQVMTWKRIVQGVREMCDVCSTTIFNIHWVCPICGFAVCIDCYKVRKQGIIEESDEDQPKDRDEYKWLLCTMRQPHEQDSLIMAQMIPGKALWVMRDLLHKARLIWKIPSFCKCNPQTTTTQDKLVFTGINKQLISCVTKSFVSERKQSGFSFEKNMPKSEIGYDDLDIEVSGSALRWLEGPGFNSENINNNFKLSDDSFNSYEDYRILSGGLFPDMQENVTDPDDPDYDPTAFSLDEIIDSVKKSHDMDKDTPTKWFGQRYPQPNSGRDPLPIRIYTKIESELAFPNVPHSWFCNGRLLFLHQADHKDNLEIFQEQWKRGQPILVKSVQEGLDMSLWHPDGFCRDFGEVKNDLVDCKTGNILKNLPMKKFWEGFESFNKRLTDENGEHMLLKLKDWPPGEDFSEKLPTRFEDLMKGLPLPEYTHRNGILNLAGRLPLSFVRPDLGPKMYNAYGSALYPTKGTTNLHLDVSDAVNVMVYVGIPSDGNAQIHVEEALKAIDEGGCDSLMRARVRIRGTKPGALWHIYNARDADKIRDMLNKVAIEKGEKLEANHDPIHDQSWYIDAELRMRLYRDYGVEGYAIAQCLGDAVFIPAGAPHQVRNLHSCVKVAEDFVSPENIAHCFTLTQEFRNLSDTHTNHEDKLQIKNIIYHVVRDSLSHLLPEDEQIS